VNETAAGLGAFWAFSLRLYGAAGVQQTLLRMQDEDAPHMAIAWTRRRCGALNKALHRGATMCCALCGPSGGA
jgi:hypothetical protein